MKDPHEWGNAPTFFSATNANPTPPPVNGAFVGIVWGLITWVLVVACLVGVGLYVWSGK